METYIVLEELTCVPYADLPLLRNTPHISIFIRAVRDLKKIYFSKVEEIDDQRSVVNFLFPAGRKRIHILFTSPVISPLPYFRPCYARLGIELQEGQRNGMLFLIYPAVIYN